MRCIIRLRSDIKSSSAPVVNQGEEKKVIPSDDNVSSEGCKKGTFDRGLLIYHHRTTGVVYPNTKDTAKWKKGRSGKTESNEEEQEGSSSSFGSQLRSRHTQSSD